MFGIGASPSVSSGVPGYDGDCTVWLHVVGSGPPSTNATLCEEKLSVPLIGDVNVTVPPGVISTVLSPVPPAASWKKLSPVLTAASTGAESAPAASAGAPIRTTMEQAIQGR